MRYQWPVVPLCEAQLRDIRPKDVLQGGLFRYCDISECGNFDSFSAAAQARYDWVPDPKQFVVQLQGCPLKCPYCYITDAGINGKAKMLSTSKLLDAYYQSGCQVFHLMGGAPALHINGWRELGTRVHFFHSDLLLVESFYDRQILRHIPGLHAVSIKHQSLYSERQLSMMFQNMKTVLQSGLAFYLTITGEDTPLSSAILQMVPPALAEGVIRIPIRKYKALEEQEHGNH